MTAKQIAKRIVDCFKRGNKCLVFGNGGSLADASHFAAEFNGIGPVIALNDPAKITSIGNDYGFPFVFVMQLRDMASPGDLIIGISSSGNSANVLYGSEFAENNHLEYIDWPRKGKTTAEVQEYQYKLLHEVYLIVKKVNI